MKTNTQIHKKLLAWRKENATENSQESNSVCSFALSPIPTLAFLNLSIDVVCVPWKVQILKAADWLLRNQWTASSREKWPSLTNQSGEMGDCHTVCGCFSKGWDMGSFSRAVLPRSRNELHGSAGGWGVGAASLHVPLTSSWVMLVHEPHFEQGHSIGTVIRMWSKKYSIPSSHSRMFSGLCGQEEFCSVFKVQFKHNFCEGFWTVVELIS